MKTLMIFSAAMLLSLSMIAQPASLPAPKKQRMEARKIGFLTHHLDLTAEEAQKFWPVYNQYHNELKALKKNHIGKRIGQKENDGELSDKEIEEFIMKDMELSQKKLDLKKKYHAKFKEVLPMKKLARLYKAEKNFMKKSRDRKNIHGQKQSHPMD